MIDYRKGKASFNFSSLEDKIYSSYLTQEHPKLCS